MTAPAPLLRVRDVAIVHDEATRATPSSVSFAVRPGEAVLLLGPSGCGKSTLALALNGLVPRSVPAEVRGSIEVDGLRAGIDSVARLSTRVAMVQQDPDAQIVTGSVLDEVAFGPENLLLPVEEVLRRSEDALRRVGLWARRDDDPAVLSGGGRQRLAIAAALAMGSPLLVLDEPTANLDPQGAEQVYAALAEVVATGDRAIVLVEHDLDAAIGLAGRAVVLDRLGAVVAEGPVDLLRDRAEELLALGIWLPTATLAALRLRGAGVGFERLPLTAAELREALAAHPEPIAVALPDARSFPPAGGSASPDARSSPPRAVVPRADPGRNDSAGEAGGGTASAPPLVVARDLRISRRRAPVLHGVDLSIAAGSFTAIVGANGAGKTTLLQALCGVLRPPKGSVSIDGVDVGRADARLLGRRVGFVFQNPEHQFVTSTVLDEVAHELRRQGLEPDEVERRARATLRRFGLEHRAEAHPFLLSGGQKRRLSVAAALVAGAELLALDEPTFGQDRERAEELLALLSDLNAAGTTVLVVTHDLQLVAEHASDVIVLGEGRLLAHGPVGAVLADDALLERSGLRPPPLHAALRDVPGHPELATVTRFAELPSSGGRAD